MAEGELTGAPPVAVVPPVAVAPSAPVRRRVRARPIIISLILLAAVAVAAYFGYGYWRDATLYISTDDALVDTTTQSITSPGAGTLLTWRVQLGQHVRAGEVIGLVRPIAGTVALPSYNVTAPIDGTVIRVDAREGQPIASTLPLAYVSDMDNVRITAFIDETDIAGVHVGQPVDITVDATGANAYTGTVSEIIPATAGQFALLPSTDRSTANFTKVAQRVEVHIALTQTNGAQLFPGENANVRIHR